MSTTAAFIAATRFGLGASRGELTRLAAAPRESLEAQIAAPRTMPPELGDLRGSQEIIRKYQPIAQRKGGDRKELRQDLRAIYMEEAAARTIAAIRSDTPLVERLVAFWSNHFTVSIKKPVLSGIVGAYEREAIRPHVSARFADMLLAVVRHPAMLFYLDNHTSFGPNSFVGRRKDVGLNENLAREVLELHTLGVDGGYGQYDVEALAAILTGWSAGGPRLGEVGRFQFYDLGHEPGAKALLGRRYSEAGEEEGVQALRDLARHPSTAHHVAVKLARHFIADDPPASAVNRLARLFLETDGDLAVVTRALISAPEAWREPMVKFKTPNEFVISALRPIGYTADGEPLVKSLGVLGQLPFDAPSPAGWPDTSDAWLGPNALLHRVEWAYTLAGRTGGRPLAEMLARETIAPVATDATLQTIARAADARDALALLLSSPEFQRR